MIFCRARMAKRCFKPISSLLASNSYLHMADHGGKALGLCICRSHRQPRALQSTSLQVTKNRLFLAATRKSVQPPKSALCAHVKTTECYKHIFTLWLASGSCKSWQRAPCNLSSGHAWLVIIWNTARRTVQSSFTEFGAPCKRTKTSLT